MAKPHAPTPKSEASQTHADNEAHGPTDPDAPVAATQDPDGPGREHADAGAGCPQSPNRKAHPGEYHHPGRSRYKMASEFADACDLIADAVRKFTDAGMGAAAAGELALRVYGHCCRGGD